MTRRQLVKGVLRVGAAAGAASVLALSPMSSWANVTTMGKDMTSSEREGSVITAGRRLGEEIVLPPVGARTKRIFLARHGQVSVDR